MADLTRMMSATHSDTTPPTPLEIAYSAFDLTGDLTPAELITIHYSEVTPYQYTPEQQAMERRIQQARNHVATMDRQIQRVTNAIDELEQNLPQPIGNIHDELEQTIPQATDDAAEPMLRTRTRPTGDTDDLANEGFDPQGYDSDSVHSEQVIPPPPSYPAPQSLPTTWTPVEDEDGWYTPRGVEEHIIHTNESLQALGSWETLPSTVESLIEPDGEDQIGGMAQGTDDNHNADEATDSDDDDAAYVAFHEEACGYGVLDSGATSSFGSVEAADQQQLLRMSNSLFRRPEVDTENSSSFRFGSGAAASSTSIATMPIDNEAVGESEARVSLFMGQQRPIPIMLGIDFHRDKRLCIDYELDLATFKDDPKTIYKLKRSTKGLLMIPMCGQEMQHANPDEDDGTLSSLVE